MVNLLRLLIITAFFNALTWIILVPIWQYPDEQAHFSQVQDLAELGKVPIGAKNTSEEIIISELYFDTRRNTLGNNKFTYHPEYKMKYVNAPYGEGEREISTLSQSSRITLVANEATNNPPLYYFLGEQVYKLFYNTSLFTRVYSVRLFSLILYTMNTFVIIKIAQLVFKKNEVKQVFSYVLITAFMPMYVFSNTGVLPDPLTNLLFTVFIWLCLLILNKGINPSSILAILITIALGFFTRQHFILAIGIFFCLICVYFIKNRLFSHKLLLLAASLLIGPVLITQFRIQIPFIGYFRIPESLGMLRPQLIFDYNIIYYLKNAFMDYYHKYLPWYLGVYKWLSLTPPIIFYRIIKIILLLSLIGLFIIILRYFKSGVNFRKTNYLYVFAFIASVFYFFAFVIGDYYFQRTYGYSFGIQGRYFFPINALLGLLLVKNLDSLFKFLKIEKLHLVIGIFIIFFNFYSLIYLAHSYYNFASLGTLMLDLSHYKPQFLKSTNLLIVLISIILIQIFTLSKSIFLIIKNDRH